MSADRSSPGRIGVYLPTFPQHDVDRAWERVDATVVAAEALGAQALWVADHLFWANPVLDCFTVATVALARSSTVAVGTAVLQLPLRHTPSVAKTCASLQQLGGGRFVLGVGVGSHEGEYEAAGRDHSRRGSRLDAQLGELDALWHPGEQRYEQRPAPAAVPIWFGGAGAHVRRRVVAHGSGWNSAFLRPKGFAEERRRLEVELEQAGRDPAEVTMAATVAVRVGAKDEVLPDALTFLSSMYSLDRRLFLGHLAAGDLDHCVERVRGFVEAGADHVALVVAADDPVPDLEQLVPRMVEAWS